MGMRHFVYIGPYVKIKNVKGPIFYGDEFAEAGLDEEKFRNFEYADHPSDERWLYVNSDNVGRHFNLEKTGGTFSIDFNTIDVKHETNAVGNTFPNYLDILEGLYGVENVSVEYGVIGYYR
jgi:hypothetical protein